MSELRLGALQAAPLALDDAPELQALLESCAADLRRIDGYAPDRRAALERISEALGDPEQRLWGLRRPGVPGLAGLLDLRLHQPAPGEATVALLLLAPAQRRRGLGAALASAVRDWAEAEGLQALRLGVRDGDAAAALFWEAQSYRPDGEDEGVTNYVLELGASG